jgi:hypothetical protein
MVLQQPLAILPKVGRLKASSATSSPGVRQGRAPDSAMAAHDPERPLTLDIF